MMDGPASEEVREGEGRKSRWPGDEDGVTSASVTKEMHPEPPDPS